ncbi:hypothetical protein BDY21DRAFT_289684 [Lineolata rhizophorae]|uniref:M-phase inducer phosphatase n=1 Tax=Lineolata rhizophorae TaxID=578093 RepID=A0A6A6NUB2_9PEZI|nr:hypothetical protein BDY21DRAFT_289684 [Lineolata rhizophorae]
MECSSPLAAIQQHAQPAPPWALRRDLPGSRHVLSSHSLGANNFNFKDLSVKKSSNSDYFGLKSARGSSPTASLAADLSQNFHIDQSPQLPTPRRSLFTASALSQWESRGEFNWDNCGRLDLSLAWFPSLISEPVAEGATTPPIRVEGVTTPPIPSSSPSFGPDSMDISPLPHKAPHSFVTQVPLPSPTPESTPHDEDMLSPCSPAPTNPLVEVKPPVNNAADRRKPPFPRPSLSRAKGYSSNAVYNRAKAVENQLPPFQFGAGSYGTSTSSSLSLAECFTESPPSEKNSMFNVMPMGPPRPRQPHFGSSSSIRANGSPSAGCIRKPGGPAPRPRKQFRRSLSMFEHPGDVMKAENTEPACSGLQSIMDIDDTHKLQLPHFTPEGEPDSLPRIDKATLIDVMDGRYGHMFEQTMVVDCRFEYEYDGGHIQGAVNFNDKEALAKHLFTQSVAKTLLVFHCEYSAHRAPMMAKFVRQRDRALNDHQYPKLTYPEVYILDGGYSAFFGQHRMRCFPQNYVEMGSKEHEQDCERGMGRLRHRSKLHRAQTFAFGSHQLQQQQGHDDSPTGAVMSRADAYGRGAGNGGAARESVEVVRRAEGFQRSNTATPSAPCFGLGESNRAGGESSSSRLPTRRMASY